MNTTELQKIKQRYNVVGNSDELNRALDVAMQVAPTDLSVLIIGESGVGKEIIPRIIHDNSPRKREKYFAVNCGSIPEGTIDSELFGHEKGAFTGAIGESEGYFGVANKGTIFLDEVGELPLATQARLLRVLETGEYIRVGGQKIMKTDVRIVAATNVNMRKAVSEGRFREDLYYRLNTIPIQMPPLRDRGNDILLLFRLFAMQMADKYNLPKITLDDDAKQLMLKYKWPGNVRQLKNITEQMSVLAEERVITGNILLHFIPQDQETTQLATVGKENGTGQHSYENERDLLYKILYELRGNVAELRREVNSLRDRVEHSENCVGGLKTLARPDTLIGNNGDIIDGSESVLDAQKTEKYRHADSVPAVIPAGRQDLERSRQPVVQDAVAEEISEAENLNLENTNKQMLIKALEKNNGNRKKAAEELGISDRTIYRKIRQYGLEN